MGYHSNTKKTRADLYFSPVYGDKAVVVVPQQHTIQQFLLLDQRYSVLGSGALWFVLGLA